MVWDWGRTSRGNAAIKLESRKKIRSSGVYPSGSEPPKSAAFPLEHKSPALREEETCSELILFCKVVGDSASDC
jgi:hypothetical protein